MEKVITSPGNIILYEDDWIVAVNKPSEMLSVPGKNKTRVITPRFKEWEVAIKNAVTHDPSNLTPACIIALERLQQYKNIPRKERSFYGYVERTLKITSSDLLSEIWSTVKRVDEKLHKQPIDDIPSHLVSATEIIEKKCGKVYNVHRLDCATSGILLLAKTDSVAKDLSEQFRERNVKKIYVAEVLGELSPDVKSISVPIRPDLENRPMQIVDYKDGKPSETIVYHVLTKLCNPISSSSVNSSDQSQPLKSTIVLLLPVTGRTHQLRLHMATIGHPILGDTLYASSEGIEASPTCLRLHAISISFTHPSKQQLWTTLESFPCPFYPDLTSTQIDIITNDYRSSLNGTVSSRSKRSLLDVIEMNYDLDISSVKKVKVDAEVKAILLKE